MVEVLQMNKKIFSIFWVLLLLAVNACSPNSSTGSAMIKASGTISADEVNISAEIAGKVLEVLVEEGQAIKKGDMLFKLDTQLIQAQVDQAAAAVETAKAAAVTTQTQYDLTLQNAQLADQKNRLNTWRIQVPTKFDLPVWYFQKSEQINAAHLEMEKTLQQYNQKLEKGKSILEGEKNQQLLSLEKRIAQTQFTYQAAHDTLNQATSAKENTELKDAAQKIFDAAEEELDNAQAEYDQLLSNKEYDTVLATRARIQAARTLVDNAIEKYNQLLTGDQSLQVQVANDARTQAQALLAQAEATLKVLGVQLEKCLVKAPLDGIVITRNLQAGESIAPTGTVMTIADLSSVKLVVYVPEDQYGNIFVGQEVVVNTDSYAGLTFHGKVTHIADQAEFTPRNVQTVEGRRSTVYAIDITIPNAEMKLKPGMPVDAEFKIKSS
jgi:HlyD family secretion protein